MASIRNNKPLTRGPWAGCVAVRWRPVRGGKQERGYLPDPTYLESYSEYEKGCWNSGQLPDAPEVRFRAQVDELLADRRRKFGQIEEGAGSTQLPALTLRQWVGTRTYHGSNRYTYEEGLFFKYATKRSGEASKRSHIKLVSSPELAHLADEPMAANATSEYTLALAQMLACQACVQRARDAGHTPGSPRLPWDHFVPVLDEPTWDGAACAQHRTEMKEQTYKVRTRQLAAHYNATRSPGASDVPGIEPMSSPVPPLSRFGRVLFRSSIVDGGDEREELRYGLSGPQVEDLRDASPDHLRVVPVVGTWTLSRGGQELFGFRIRDVQPVDPFAIRDNNLGVDGEVAVHNFRRRLNNGRHINWPIGKTGGTRRSAPFAPSAMATVITHIRTWRSTPHPDCPGCAAGHGHWSTRDHARNPHVWDEEQDINCPMAADAPLIADENGAWMEPTAYAALWDEILSAAALTEQGLGWRLVPRHFRATGTGLHMTSAEPDVELVRRLGGWSTTEMLRDHYLRHTPESRLAAARRVEVAHFATGLTDDGEHEEFDEVAALKGQIKLLTRHVGRAERLLVQAGIDPAGRTARVVTQQRSVFENSDRILDAVETVVVGRRRGSNAILEELGVAAAKGNYSRLRLSFARLNLPPIPTHWANMSANRQQPYLDELVAALGVHGRTSGGLRAV